MSNITTWPWPRLLTTKYHTFYIHRSTAGNILIGEMYISNGTWTYAGLVSMAASSLINSVSIADFGPFYVISTLGDDGSGNQVVSMYIRDVNAAASGGSMSSFSKPACGTCINFQGQFVGGNIYSPSGDSDNYWSSLGANGIAWSGIGNFEFDPSIDRTAGWMELFFPFVSGQRAIIYKLLQLDKSVIAYSDSGIIVLSPGDSGGNFSYGQKPMSSIGVRSGNHIAGDDTIHGYVDRNNEFWVLQGNETSKLGYKEQITAMTNADIAVSYLPRDRRFYISDGVTCLVVNRFGAYTTYQRVSSAIIGYDGILYGTFSDDTDTKARIVTDIVDYGSRDIKSLESMVAGMQFNGNSSAKMGVDWRMGVSDSFRRSTLVPANAGGEAYIQVAANEFRLVIEITNPSEVEIAYIMQNVKFSDRKFRRGLAPGASKSGGVVTI